MPGGPAWLDHGGRLLYISFLFLSFFLVQLNCNSVTHTHTHTAVQAEKSRGKKSSSNGERKVLCPTFNVKWEVR